ncbi:MAG: TRAP transporter large permease [Spirochaetaceae bacterium]|nr:TRAP transporter large permease [Spirochaetaceae bacterium]
MKELATLVLLGGFFVLMFLRVPVTFALLLATLGSAAIMHTNLTVMVRMMIDGVSNFSLLAIPFFILMGEIMAAGKVSDRIIDLANLVVGRFRGGLAYVNVISSTFFGGISGSAVADVSSLGSVVIPMMKKQGYDPEFSVGLTVTTACQGVLIPPSHNMVIYSLAAGGVPTIATMFMAGFIPGIWLGLCFCVYCFFAGKKYNFPKGFKIGTQDKVRWLAFGGHRDDLKAGLTKSPASWYILNTRSFSVEMGKCFGVVLNSILPMFTLVIIMGGVALGIFTATESAAVACVYAFILTYFILRTDKLSHFPQVLKGSLRTLATVLTLIATAKAFAYMMTLLRIPAMITNALVSITDNRILLLLIINALLLVLGCFMDMAPLIMIMTPILYPVVTGPIIHMHPAQFGIMLIFNLAIGLCTPPVGSALFVGCAVGHTSLEKTAKKELGLFLTMVFSLMCVVFVPALSMTIPKALGMA